MNIQPEFEKHDPARGMDNDAITQSLGPFLASRGFVEVAVVPDPELWANRFLRGKHGIEAGIAIVDDQEFLIRIVNLPDGCFTDLRHKNHHHSDVNVRAACELYGISPIPPRQFVRSVADRERIPEIVESWLPALGRLLEYLETQGRLLR